MRQRAQFPQDSKCRTECLIPPPERFVSQPHRLRPDGDRLAAQRLVHQRLAQRQPAPLHDGPVPPATTAPSAGWSMIPRYDSSANGGADRVPISLRSNSSSEASAASKDQPRASSSLTLRTADDNSDGRPARSTPSSRPLSSRLARPAISVTSTRMSLPTEDGSMWLYSNGSTLIALA